MALELYYKLGPQHEVRRCEHYEVDWAPEARRVAVDSYGDEDNRVDVSTVFLPLDHNYTGVGPPLVFETLVFGGTLDEEMRRYATWDEAVAGHQQMCRMVEATLLKFGPDSKQEGE